MCRNKRNSFKLHSFSSSMRQNYSQWAVMKFNRSINLKLTLIGSITLVYKMRNYFKIIYLIIIQLTGFILLTSPQKSYGWIEIGLNCAAHRSLGRRWLLRHPAARLPMSDGAAGPVTRSCFGSCINCGNPLGCIIMLMTSYN